MYCFQTIFTSIVLVNLHNTPIGITYETHVTDEEIEAYRAEIICPRSHGQYEVDLDVNLYFPAELHLSFHYSIAAGA